MGKRTEHMNDDNREIMEEIFLPRNLDFLYDDEKEDRERCSQSFKDYLDGKMDGIKYRQVSSYYASLAKFQQSRSAAARLKFDVLNKYRKQN